MPHNPPPTFRTGHSGDLACPHRDLSCCDACAQAHPEIVEVYGQHFWVADVAERGKLRAGMADARDREADARLDSERFTIEE